MLPLAKCRPPPLTSRALLIGICSLFISCLPPRQNAAVWFFNDGPAFSSANCRFTAVTGGNQLFFVTSAQKRPPRLGRDLLILDLGTHPHVTRVCAASIISGIGDILLLTFTLARIKRTQRVYHFKYRESCTIIFDTREDQTNAPRPFCKAAKGLGCFHFDTRLRENMRLADFVPIAEFARQSICERCGVSSNSPTTLQASRIPRSARVRRPHIAPRSTCRARRSSPRPSSPSCPPPRPPNACSRR